MYLIELIESYFSDYRNHSSKANEIMVCCPFCEERGHVGGPDQLYKLGINTLQEVAHCHRCDWSAGGKGLFNALADYANISDAYESDNSGEQLEEKVKTPKLAKLEETALPVEFEPLWEEQKERLGKEAKNYLLKRGVSEDQIKRHKIGFCAVGEYSYRIVLPVFFGPTIVGFTTRTFRNATPKYLNSSGEKFLFNYPRKRTLRKEKAILVEGPFDALSLELTLGAHYDCIGRFGSSLTAIQLKALAKYEQLVLWPDPDIAGAEGLIKVAKQLGEETNCKLMGIVPSREIQYDPGAMERQEILSTIKSKRPWTGSLERKLKVRVLF